MDDSDARREEHEEERRRAAAHREKVIEASALVMNCRKALGEASAALSPLRNEVQKAEKELEDLLRVKR